MSFCRTSKLCHQASTIKHTSCLLLAITCNDNWFINREKRIGVDYCVGLLLIVLVLVKRTLSPVTENGMTLIESLN